MRRFVATLPLFAAGLMAGCGSSEKALPKDEVAPTVATAVPADGATVGSLQKLQIAFSEAMNEATVTVAVTDGGGGSYALGSPTWNAARSGVSFNSPPSPLAFGAAYQVAVEGKDLSGNALGGTKSFNFAVAAQPAVVAFAPVGGAADQARETRPKVTFNQAMERASVESALTVQEGSTPVACLFAWSPDSTEVTCIPPAVFAFGASVTVAVASTARSALGDALAAAGSASFAVAAAPVPPAVAGVTPPPGTTDASTGTAVVVTFTKPMNLASAQTAFSTSPFADGTFTWDSSDTIMTFRPAAAFAHGISVTWTVSTAAQDKAGLAMAAAATGNFHVVRETTVTINPLAGQTGYVFNAASLVTGGTLRAGDTLTNLPYRGFASFPLVASLPATTKTITAATLQASGSSAVGTPFAGGLGSFRVQGVFYDTLDTGDWDVATDGFYSIRPCLRIIVLPARGAPDGQALAAPSSGGETNAIIPIPIPGLYFCAYEATPTAGDFSLNFLGKVQSDFASAAARNGLSQFRLRFVNDTDSDGGSDFVIVPTLQLVVTAEYGW